MLDVLMNSPATGDRSWIVGVVLAVAAAAIIGVLIWSKKKGDDDK